MGLFINLSLEDNEPIILPRPHPISKIFECLVNFFCFTKKLLKDLIYFVDEIQVLLSQFFILNII